MPGKIFVNYRRDDDPNGAARVRDGLAAKFGKANIFMDVDNLLAGQRFDKELEKALAQCDVLIAVMGTRWMDQLRARAGSGERDYVREEIAAALARQLTVIPVRIGREGQLSPLPRQQDLPEDIQDLLHYQKHDVTHERFGRDIAELNEAIVAARRAMRPPRRMSRLAVGALAAAAIMGVAAWAAITKPWEPKIVIDDNTEKKDVVVAPAAPKRSSPFADPKPPAPPAAIPKDHLAEEIGRITNKLPSGDPVAALNPGSGKSARDCPECPEMVVVPAGRFKMGEGSKARDMTIQQPFAVGKFEVTFDEWAACVIGGGCTSNRNPSDQGWGQGRHPVINVSWHDAMEYVRWLSRKTGQTYRLLTAAESEYAARAGTTTAYWWGNKFDGSKANNGSQTVPVGQYAANAFGLHDMHGNVWEWCVDPYNAGSRSDEPDRSWCRDWGAPDFRLNLLGFRVARDLSPAKPAK